MDPLGNIYQTDGEVPLVDAARLDGYLRGRAEAAELARMREETTATLARIAADEEADRRGSR